MNEAKQLMTANPDRKMEDIAYTVGFSSPSYFSKVFASHEGMSPTVWRREVMSK
ncbi:helix-turn-helix domain-containing protein [Prevotella sp.]|uniref:helix-turn-helix domain-containing protein n=1 Tax=Prevotella sp. TaxID=59823 RepID=UPI002E794759|nr:helix-turn-helix domain-containing protein [Prevotella sp.]MEE0671056.1 helix-turn-helix domain-containing protein [Prevotella sp.]